MITFYKRISNLSKFSFFSLRIIVTPHYAYAQFVKSRRIVITFLKTLIKEIFIIFLDF